jgi:Zn-finger nucleic acid-binding protein
LTADVIAGEASQWSCPTCAGRRLFSRRLPDPTVTALECRVCAGLWIGLEAFHELLNAEERQRRQAAASHRGAAVERPRGFRKCPHCSGLMIRRNLGRGESGIIVDVCGEHGLWFDDDELSRVIAWMRTGGLESARRDVARLKSSPDAQRKRRGREPESAAQPDARPTISNVFVRRGRNGISSEIQFVADTLANVFGWPKDGRTWRKSME